MSEVELFMLQTLSLNYIDASTYIVLLQLILVFTAVGERVVLKQNSTIAIWILILLQFVCVSYYEVSSLSGQKSGSGHNLNEYLTGMGICLVACIFNAVGTILQQRFLQQGTKENAAQTKQKVIMPSVKLCYQHIIGLVLMFASLGTNPSSIVKIYKLGFFHGWTKITYFAAVSMWLSFFTASSVTAYVSAMAGAMGSAVVVIVVGICGAIVNGKQLTIVQITVVCAIAAITSSYTILKFQMLTKRAENELNKPLLQNSDEPADDGMAMNERWTIGTIPEKRSMDNVRDREKKHWRACVIWLLAMVFTVTRSILGRATMLIACASDDVFPMTAVVPLHSTEGKCVGTPQA